MSFSASSISHYYLQVTGHLVFGVFGVRVKIASDGFYSDPKILTNLQTVINIPAFTNQSIPFKAAGEIIRRLCQSIV